LSPEKSKGNGELDRFFGSQRKKGGVLSTGMVGVFESALKESEKYLRD
jgi:hypothetical protein